MKVAFNGLALTPRQTGIRRASQHMLDALRAQRPGADVLAFLPQDAPPALEGVRTRVTLERPLAPLLGEELLLRGASFDVSYSPSYLLPRIPGARADVVCVHDLAPGFRAHLAGRLAQADHVVCPSRATADALARDFDIAARVVPHGVDAACFRPGARRREDPYVAVVASAGTPRDVETVLEAFPAFRARLRPCRMVVVGGAPAPRCSEQGSKSRDILRC